GQYSRAQCRMCCRSALRFAPSLARSFLKAAFSRASAACGSASVPALWRAGGGRLRHKNARIATAITSTRLVAAEARSRGLSLSPVAVDFEGIAPPALFVSFSVSSSDWLFPGSRVSALAAGDTVAVSDYSLGIRKVTASVSHRRT